MRPSAQLNRPRYVVVAVLCGKRTSGSTWVEVDRRSPHVLSGGSGSHCSNTNFCASVSVTKWAPKRWKGQQPSCMTQSRLLMSLQGSYLIKVGESACQESPTGKRCSQFDVVILTHLNAANPSRRNVSRPSSVESSDLKRRVTSLEYHHSL